MLSVLLAALWFTTPSYGIDIPSLDCGAEDSSAVQNITTVRLFRALCGGTGQFLLVREKSTTSANAESLEVVTTECATYAISTLNGAGLESCRVYITVGIPSVGVGPSVESVDLGKVGAFYDLRGARLRNRPTARGIYWFKQEMKKSRMIVVL